VRETAVDGVRSFKSSAYWRWNLWGATIAGFGGGMLLSTLNAIGALRNLDGAWGSESLKIAFFVWALCLLTWLAYFPGNAIARYPYKLIIETGKGLRVYAPFKKLYIPVEDLREVGFSGEGTVVRLKRRRRMLTTIVIHRFFGSQRDRLANALREEIQRGAS
jgi:hypothetical protein